MGRARALSRVMCAAVPAGAGVSYRSDVAYATGDGEGGVTVSHASADQHLFCFDPATL